MNICTENVSQETPELIQGHIYQYKTFNLYIYNSKKELVGLTYGTTFSCEKEDLTGWKDVTNNYCLQKVK